MALFSLRLATGRALRCSPDGHVWMDHDIPGMPILMAGAPGGVVLLEAPGHGMKIGNLCAGEARLVHGFMSETAEDGTFLLKSTTEDSYLQNRSGVLFDGATPDLAAAFRVGPPAEPADAGVLRHLPESPRLDEHALARIFDERGADCIPILEALLPFFATTTVRTAWSSTKAASKSVFQPAVREHGRAGTQRFKTYTRDILKDDAERFGWSIGEESYGIPLILEPSLGKLTIGRYCSLANPSIILGNHSSRTVTTYPFAALWFEWPGTTTDLIGHVSRDVVIGNDVWIGHEAIILPGAVIGDGCVIGAGCVVGGTIPPYSVCVGNPGRVRSRRFDDATIERLLRIRWWDWEAGVIDRYLPLLLSHDIARFLDAAEQEFLLDR